MPSRPSPIAEERARYARPILAHIQSRAGAYETCLGFRPRIRRNFTSYSLTFSYKNLDFFGCGFQFKQPILTCYGLSKIGSPVRRALWRIPVLTAAGELNPDAVDFLLPAALRNAAFLFENLKSRENAREMETEIITHLSLNLRLYEKELGCRLVPQILKRHRIIFWEDERRLFSLGFGRKKFTFQFRTYLTRPTAAVGNKKGYNGQLVASLSLAKLSKPTLCASVDNFVLRNLREHIL